MLKESCKDPSRLQDPSDVTNLIAKAGLVEPMYMILDGLDELKDPRELLSLISSFTSSSINVLVTSRDLPHIRKTMDSASHLKIEGNKADLQLYVKLRFRDSDFSDEVDEDDSVITDIVSKSDNLFLLARLTLDDVLDLATVNQIRKAVGEPQTGLEQAFKATMKRIDAQSKARSLLARRLLAWITYAKRRLKLEEVLCALGVEDDDEELQQDNMPNPDILLRACLGLVILEPSDNTLGLVHVTVYEFFKNGKLSESITNSDIARTCLRYLTMEHLSGGVCNDSIELTKRFRTLTFLDYSAKHWGEHTTPGNDELNLELLIMRLLRNPKFRAGASQALQYRQEYTDESFAEEILHSLPTNQEALHLVAYWNLTRTAEMLLAEGANVSAVDSQKWTPLHWACSRNHPTIAELLVRRGADVNYQDVQGWTPLFWAAFIGNPKLVRLLLDNGANHLITSTLGWSALHWAISGGHLEVVKELLEHHSRSQLPEPELIRMNMSKIMVYAESTLPVQIASDNKDPEIFNLLVQHIQTSGGLVGDAKFNLIWSHEKFDVPASKNPWRTMTKGEMANGRESIIPRFTGNYAENSSVYRADSVEWKSILLLSAIRDKQLASVQLLIKGGADVNYQNVLHVAACRRDPRYVQCLLQGGADPSATNVRGWSALHEAVFNGFLETIKALIDGGANVNQSIMKDLQRGWPSPCQLEGGTALMQACGFLYSERGPEFALEITSLLLSKGADVCLRNASGMTVLHCAVLRPYFPLIELLINEGCPVDLPDQHGGTALHYLAKSGGGNTDIEALKRTVRLILSVSGADTQSSILNQPICLTQIELDEANGAKRKELMSKFMNSGRYFDNRNSLQVEHCTPISIALCNERWEIVRILYDAGARFPIGLRLDSILGAAIKDLAVDTVELLLNQGAAPPEVAVLTLLKSVCACFSKGHHAQNISHDSFRRILTSIVTAGADINSLASGTDEDRKLRFDSSDINALDSDMEDAALTIAARMPIGLNILQDLLSFGADLYSTSPQTFDPILTCAVYGGVENLGYLLEIAAARPNPCHWSRYLSEELGATDDPIIQLCSCLQRANALNQANRKGRTLLHLAAGCGNDSLVFGLLACKAQTNVADEEGWLAVHCAGFAQKVAAIQALLPLDEDECFERKDHPRKETERTSNLKALLKKNHSGQSIIHIALENNNVPMIHHLLRYGMNPNLILENYQNDKTTLLHHAAEKGHRKLVSILIDMRANIEASDHYGWRPLHVACLNGHTEFVKTLIKAGSHIHAETIQWNNDSVKPTGLYSRTKWTGQPLHLAVMSGDLEIVKMLLDKGVDIHASTGVAQDKFSSPGHGPTALHLALDNDTFYGRRGGALDDNRLQIAQFLVSRGAMVQGVIRRFSLDNILKFRNYPELWDALVAGELQAEEVNYSVDTSSISS